MNEFITEQYEIYKAKNSLYGDSFKLSLEKWGYLAFGIRIEDKLNRIRQLLSNKDFSNELLIVSDESISDTIRDLFNYTAMFISYIEQISVFEAMNNIYNNIKCIQDYLFSMYTDNYLLNPNKIEDVTLYNNIVNLLKIMWRDNNETKI
jgi:hypothetical protein